MVRRYRRRRRRRRKRRRTTRLTRQMPGFQGQPLGRQFKTTLRYAENVVIGATSAGTASNYLFNCMNINDPNVTGVGHQPMGYDDIKGFYDHYTVIGAKITCLFTQQSDFPLFVGLKLIDAAGSGVNTAMEAIERGQGKYGVLGDRDAATHTKLTLGFSPKKYFNCSSIIGNTRFQSQQDAGPVEDLFFNLWTGATQDNQSATQVAVNVLIEYLVVFTEPKPLNQS